MTDLEVSNIERALTRKGYEEVVLLIDTSGSMNGPVPGQPKLKLHAACEAVVAITNVSDPKLTHYAVCWFESRAGVFVPLTDDFMDIQFEIFKLRTGGGTSMDLGISCALQQNPNRIVLLSDGSPTCSMEQLWSVVDTAANLGVRIDTIGIGDANDEVMREIARRTGGKYTKCESPEQLTQAFIGLETRNLLRLEHHAS